MVTDDDLLFTGDVARLANRTPDAVRVAIRAGRLSAIRTGRGTHLIRREDAEAYARSAADRDRLIATIRQRQ
jgi:hypothetical protein